MKKNVALITGGLSSESKISYKSAESVLENIDQNIYNLYKIDLRKEGWFYMNEKKQEKLVNKEDFSIVISKQKIHFDGVFICIHGTPGEDGKLQGYFDMLQIPYTSCNASTSALTFNKYFTKAVVQLQGISVAKSILLFKNYWKGIDKKNDSKQIENTLQFPLFVKPNNGGSSIGISKVMQKENLNTAISKAFKEDNEVIIEEFISGKEYTVGVYKHKNKIKNLPITEIISKNDFFDYEAKYLGKSVELTPAPVDKDFRLLIEDNAQKIYKILNCRGCIRIDFIYVEKTNQLYMLEVNTVPGLTNESLIPQQVAAAKIKIKDFYNILLKEMFI